MSAERYAAMGQCPAGKPEFLWLFRMKISKI